MASITHGMSLSGCLTLIARSAVLFLLGPTGVVIGVATTVDAGACGGTGMLGPTGASGCVTGSVGFGVSEGNCVFVSTVLVGLRVNEVGFAFKRVVVGDDGGRCEVLVLGLVTNLLGLTTTSLLLDRASFPQMPLQWKRQLWRLA